MNPSSSKLLERTRGPLVIDRGSELPRNLLLPIPRDFGLLILHILMEIFTSLETYPGGLSKPRAAVGITVSLVIWKLPVFLLLYYLALYPMVSCLGTNLSPITVCFNN